MADVAARLVCAAERGDLRALQACLAAGAEPSARLDSADWSPLDRAAFHQHSACVQALLEGGADPSLPDRHGSPTALFNATAGGSPACVAALLAAGADPWAHIADGRTPVLMATRLPDDTVLRMLLQAQPGPAWEAPPSASSPHHVEQQHQRFYQPLVGLLYAALLHDNLSTARCLLAEGPLQPACKLLKALRIKGAWARPLYADVASRQPLTAEWARVPGPCPGLGRALPAVLQRSAEEAALLVRHLPAAERERLRVAALCLACAQRQHSAPLPAPIAWRILALCTVSP